MGNREGILWRILHRENIKGRRRREDVLNRARLKVGEIKNTKGVERIGIRRIFCHSEEFLEGGYFYANHNHQYIVAKNKLAFHELWQKEVGFSWMYCHKFGALNRYCNVIE